MTRLHLLTELPLDAFLAGQPRCLPGEIAVISECDDQKGERAVKIFQKLDAESPQSEVA